MAFNGTKHFPAGELVKFLQRQGMKHGPHINANTSHTSTIYKLDLPDSSAASLETGLRIFRDFADGILFEPAEIRRERGVIFSEDRVRRTPQLEEILAANALLYGDTRIVHRSPIGLPNFIENADRNALRRFYDAWYRPERISIVIVGEVSPGDTARLVETHFASLVARAPAHAEPDIGTLETLTVPKIAVHPTERVGVDIGFISLTERPTQQPWTWDEYFSALHLQSALSMIEQRFRALTLQPERIVGDVQVNSRLDFLRFRRASIVLTCAPKNFATNLGLLEQEIRRTIEFGFSPDEISREQEKLRRNNLSTAAALPTAAVPMIANMLAEKVQEGSPLRISGETREQRDLFADQLTSQHCQDALRETFAPERLRIFVRSAKSFAPTKATVRETYDTSRGTSVTASEARGQKAFAYEDFGAPGRVEEKVHIADLDVWQLRLANGVRVNLKRTPYDAGHLQFMARIGYGRLAEPADKPGLSVWLPFWFYGGTAQHSAAENIRFLGGLSGISLAAEDDASFIRGRLPSANLPLALRQLTALIADPGFRPEGWETTRGIIRGYTHQLWTKPEGAIARFIRPALAGGDSRMGTVYDRQYLARTADEFRAWFSPQLADGPLEFSLVGDFDPKTAIAELTRTLGTLPSRKPRDQSAFRTQLTFPRKLPHTRYFFNGTAERPSRVAFYWTFHDTLDIRQRRNLRMLSEIFGDRLTNEVREKRGASYMPGSTFFASETYSGHNFLTGWFDVKSADAKLQSRTLNDLSATFAKKGITADELARAKAQARAAAIRDRTNNNYWLNAVIGDSQQRPDRLEAFRSTEADIESATLADMNALASRYYGSSLLFKFLIDPSALMPKKK